MSDARLVWDTWRRLLTSDRLVEWVMNPGSRTGPPDSSTADEIAILAAYADTPAATDQNIGMYRRGLVRNAVGALDLLPLTRRLISVVVPDLDELAGAYVRSTGYADYGPAFWRNAADFLAYLAERPELVSGPWADVLALDAATAPLARRLAESPPMVWPDDAAMQNTASTHTDTDRDHFVVSSAAVEVSSGYDLTAWIEDPFAFDPRTELASSPGHWLVYFPGPEAAHAYLRLSARAASALGVLQNPATAAGLARALDGVPLTEVLAMIRSLAGLGVIVAVPTPDSPTTPLSRRSP